VIAGYNCNNNCIFCSADSNSNRLINRTTAELQEDIVANSARLRKIVLIGGEFTIRKDAAALVALCRKCGYQEIAIETNGRMFSDRDFTARMVKAGLTHAAFSIHGAKAATHDRLTRVKGSWAQAMRGLENAGRHKLAVSVNFVATGYNFRELPRLAEMVSGYGFISGMVVNCVRPPMWDLGSRQLRGLVPRYSDAVEVFRTIPASRRVSFQYLPVCLAGGLNVIQQRGKKDTFNLSVRQEQRTDVCTSLMTEFMFPEICRTCSRKEQCCGIPKKYFKLYGAAELRP